MSEIVVVITGATGPSGGGGGGGASTLDDLTDVTITAAAAGDILRHNGTAWVDAVGTTHFEAAGGIATHAAVTSSVHGISAFGATLVDDADAATARTTLGLGALATLAGIRVEDEGTSTVASAVALNFVGAGVAVTDAGSGEATVTISGGGGGSVATDAIFDAKGDLPVGTGADTAAKLTVGTTGAALSADSSTSTGLRYVPVIPGFYIAGVTTGPFLARPNAGFVNPGNAATMRATLVAFARPTTLDRVSVSCSTAQAGETLRLGLYDNIGGVPTNLIADFGTVDVSTTGTKTITISQAVNAGLYFCVWVAQGGTANARYLGSDNNAQGLNAIGTELTTDFLGVVAASAATTTGALPATFGTMAATAANIVTMTLRMV